MQVLPTDLEEMKSPPRISESKDKPSSLGRRMTAAEIDEAVKRSNRIKLGSYYLKRA
jgi:hypothetical protein